MLSGEVRETNCEISGWKPTYLTSVNIRMFPTDIHFYRLMVLRDTDVCRDNTVVRWVDFHPPNENKLKDPGFAPHPGQICFFKEELYANDNVKRILSVNSFTV